MMGVKKEQCMSVHFTGIWFALYKEKLLKFFLSTIYLNRLQVGISGGTKNLRTIFDLYVLHR